MYKRQGYKIVNNGEMISVVPVTEKLLLVGEMYFITSRIEDKTNIQTLITRMEYLRSEDLGSRLYLRDEEFRTEIVDMTMIGALFFSVQYGSYPILVPFSKLEKRIKNNFGPNLIRNETI